MLTSLNKLLLSTRTSQISTKFASTYTADIILSPENRARCLKCLEGLPPMGIRLKRKSDRSIRAEKSFASVLIAVCIDSVGETSILYTRRSGLISRHVRQISFPGGIKDPEDASFEDCALRETEEEIGLPRSRVELWGSGPMINPPHTAAIMPVYGIVRDLQLDELVLNEQEVDEAFTVPIASLAKPDAFRHTQFKDGYSGPAFTVGNNRIWGITGYLTNSFLHCLLPEEESSKRPKVEFIRPFREK